jgi:DNA-binding XRE family transcriptional regulator
LASHGGTIYAIGAQGTPLVKIGSTSTAVTTRLAQLQTGQPFPLHLIAAVSVETDVARIEHQIHLFLQAEQRRGEWFEIMIDTPQLEALILRTVQCIERQKQLELELSQQTSHPHNPRIGMNPHADTPEKLCGTRIRTLRQQQQMTLEEVGMKAGFTKQQIGRVEAGNINAPLNTLVRIAAALNLNARDFFQDDDGTHTFLERAYRCSHADR